MKNPIITKCILIAACLPLLAGCVEREVVYRDRPAYGQSSGEVVVAEPPAPPPAQVEIVPVCPGPVSVWFWVPGSWEWHTHWIWVAGRWAPRPHSGAVWVAGGWTRHGHSHVWVTGHWR